MRLTNDTIIFGKNPKRMLSLNFLDSFDLKWLEASHLKIIYEAKFGVLKRASLLILYLGNLTKLDSFSFTYETGSYYSCSATINGQMLIFGGSSSYSYSNQISLVENCRLTRIGSLPITFHYGACNTFQRSDGISETLLCFASDGKSNCHRFEN